MVILCNREHPTSQVIACPQSTSTNWRNSWHPLGPAPTCWHHAREKWVWGWGGAGNKSMGSLSDICTAQLDSWQRDPQLYSAHAPRPWNLPVPAPPDITLYDTGLDGKWLSWEHSKTLSSLCWLTPSHLFGMFLLSVQREPHNSLLTFNFKAWLNVSLGWNVGFLFRQLSALLMEKQLEQWEGGIWVRDARSHPYFVGRRGHSGK